MLPRTFVRYSKAVVVDFTDRAAVPDVPGVYVATSGRRVLYVGKAERSIRDRHNSKFQSDAAGSDRGLVALAKRSKHAKLHCIPLPYGKRWIRSVEGRLIKQLHPEYNKRGERISPLISFCEFILGSLCFIADSAVAAAVLAFVALALWKALELM